VNRKSDKRKLMCSYTGLRVAQERLKIIRSEFSLAPGFIFTIQKFDFVLNKKFGSQKLKFLVQIQEKFGF
jgi:hypothetical protein